MVPGGPGTGRRVLIALAAGVVAMASALAGADVVTLKSGRSVRGKIVERRPTEIVLEAPYGRITIKNAQIVSIREESDFDRLVGEGNELAAAGHYEQAVERYRLAASRHPDGGEAGRAAVREKIVRAYRNLVRKRVAARDVAAAERALGALLRFVPDDEEGKKALARLQALRAQVTDIADRAELLFDIGAYADSIAQYRRALALAPARGAELTPRLVRAHIESGNAFFVRQRYPSAALEFRRATRLAQEAGTTQPSSDPRRQAPRSDRRLYEVRKRWAYSVLVPIINRINAGQMRLVAEWRATRAEAERVAQLAPEVPHVHFVLGLCHEALRNPAAALAAYAKITHDRPAGPATAESAEAARKKAHQTLRKDAVHVVVATKDERWLKVSPGGWQILKTDHFVIFHRNSFVAKKAARAAEYWYNALIVHWTAPGTYQPWPRKCSIYLYPDREAFHKATRQPAWVPAVSNVLARDGRLRDHRLSTYQTVRLLNESILPHELTHVIFPQLIGYPQEYPRWIHECTALLEEPDHRRHRFREAARMYLEDGVALDLKRLMAVRGHPKEDEAQRFYAQCHAMAEFLMDGGGRTKLLQFARAAAQDGDENALLTTYGFKTLSEFDRGWRRHARARK